MSKAGQLVYNLYKFGDSDSPVYSESLILERDNNNKIIVGQNLNTL